MSLTAVVAVIPDCDFCKTSGQEATPAKYDFKTLAGYWAYGCGTHYLQYRYYPDLGMGKGQELVQAPLYICTDCGHEHKVSPHGFCECGCTYPGREVKS